jgi:hypothetical protein
MRGAALAIFVILAGSWSLGSARPIAITVVNRPIAAPAVQVKHRILLPLRETFESLNSSVSYDAGTRAIVAKNVLHTLRLRVGNRSAYLDGHRIVLEAAPAAIGGRVYVPLRFAAQAMGAIVRYDARTKTVTVNGSAAADSGVSDPLALSQTLNPPPNASVVTAYPIISASIGNAVAASNAVTLLLDGSDVTAQSAFDGRNIRFVPRSGLTQGVHTVAFSGQTASGRRFSTQWSFQTAAPPMGDGAFDEAFPFRFFAGGVQPFGSSSSLMNLTLIGPPSGSGFVQFCSPQVIVPLSNGGSGQIFRARVAVPVAILNGGCPINAVFIGRFGHRFLIPVTPANNGLFLTGNPINPIGQYPSTPIFVPLFPQR